ncbi:MAG: uroporphyrinogen decarboxylase family protein [Armatimonadota bacterium]
MADIDHMLEDALAWAHALAAMDNDWPPFLNTYCTVAMVPEAFGCRVDFAEGGVPWAAPVIHDLSAVYQLKPARPHEAPMIRRQSEWIGYAQRTIGADLPVWIADVQSPFSVAAQIVDHEELLMGCYTDPAAVHHLCRIITEYTVEVMEQHLAQVEHPGFPGRNFPSISPNIGICMADDTPLIMLSPDMYREFALPYNAMLGKIFGGIHIHSCGDYRANLDNLLETPGVRSIQVHAGPGEFPLPEPAETGTAFHRARAQITCFLDTGDIARGDQYRRREMDHYAEYVLPRLTRQPLTGIILQSCGFGSQVIDAQSALCWTRQQMSTS